MTDKLIISIKEARKLLGKECENMSDEQIEELIGQLEEIARFTIKRFINERST